MFSPSAVGTLKRALLLAQRSDEVLCPFDNFSFGPIATEAVEDRVQWVEQVLGYTGWEEVTDRSQAFLAAFDAPKASVTAWLSRQETLTYAGFLWWLSHVEHLPISIIEVAELSITNAEGMVELLDRAVPFEATDRGHDVARWQRLKAENAALRVIDGENLVSAPIEHFDDCLLSHATHDWQKMARIVGGTLVEFYDAGVAQVGDLVLGARLADLAETGRLEWRGDLAHMQRCEVRLPSV
jgi:hypothetical protein